MFTVEPIGQSRGLALLLMDNLRVNVLFSNNRMIDVEAVIDGVKVFMTFVYGDPNVLHVLPLRDLDHGL